MRLSIAKMTAVVALVAVNLALARQVLAYQEFLLYGVGLMVASLQLAFFISVQSRGQVRAFWAGFLVGGFGALYSLFWMLQYENNPPEGSPLGWVVWNAWASYAWLAVAVVNRMPYAIQLFHFPTRGWLSGVVTSVVIFLPQLVAALAAGFLACRLAKSWGTRSVHVTSAPAPVD